MKEKIKVAILGSGIQGITSALALQLAGLEVTIFSKDRSDLLVKTVSQQSHSANISTYHAGASVIAHGHNTDFVKHLTQMSLRIYQHFAATASFGIRPQRHFEIFENRPKNRPNFLDVQKNVIPIEELPRSYKIPHRTAAEDVAGWRFDIYFIESIQYLDSLYNLFSVIGGKIKTQDLETRDSFEKLGDYFDILVNCGNMGGAMMYEERENMEMIAGHYIKIPLQSLPYDQDRLVNSYNYYPDSSIYHDIHGDRADLNFYPRWSWWYCGASRIRETLDENGNWVSEGLAKDTPVVNLNGVDIPRPILDVNADILKNFVGFDIRNESIPKFGCKGKRFRLVDGDGIRIDKTNRAKDNVPVFLNYGHGGAGFTLSWGAAMHVLYMVDQEIGGKLSLSEGLRKEDKSLNLDYLFDIDLDANGEFVYALRLKLEEIYNEFSDDITRHNKTKQNQRTGVS